MLFELELHIHSRKWSDRSPRSFPSCLKLAFSWDLTIEMQELQLHQQTALATNLAQRKWLYWSSRGKIWHYITRAVQHSNDIPNFTNFILSSELQDEYFS